MKICLIGNGLTNLILAKILLKKKFKVDLYFKKRKNNSLIRTIGINPDTIFTFREYGKPQRKYISDSRKLTIKKFNFLDFSGSLAKRTESDRIDVDNQGFSTTKSTPILLSPFLSASRVERGWPDPGIDNFVLPLVYPPHGIAALRQENIKRSKKIQRMRNNF